MSLCKLIGDFKKNIFFENALNKFEVKKSLNHLLPAGFSRQASLYLGILETHSLTLVFVSKRLMPSLYK